MKPKKLSRVSLKKQTIANLQDHHLSKIKGGACTYPMTGCNSVNKICCSVDQRNTCDLYTRFSPECVTDPTDPGPITDLC